MKEVGIKNWKRAVLFLSCLAMVTHGSTVVYAKKDTSVSTYSQGEQAAPDGNADVDIYGTTKGENGSKDPSGNTKTPPSTTKVGGGVNDQSTGGKTVKTGDFTKGILSYAVVFLAGAGALLILLKRKEAKSGNETKS